MGNNCSGVHHKTSSSLINYDGTVKGNYHECFAFLTPRVFEFTIGEHKPAPVPTWRVTETMIRNEHTLYHANVLVQVTG